MAHSRSASASHSRERVGRGSATSAAGRPEFSRRPDPARRSQFPSQRVRPALVPAVDPPATGVAESMAASEVLDRVLGYPHVAAESLASNAARFGRRQATAQGCSTTSSFEPVIAIATGRRPRQTACDRAAPRGSGRATSDGQ
jgi:hypothetical protein